MSNKRMFEFVEGSSSKFWEIWRDGSEVRTRYGKIGTAGQTTVKDEGTDAAGQKLYDKLVREKTGKGYVEKTAGGAAPAPVPAAPAPAPVAKPAPAKAAPKKAAVVDDDDDDGDADDGVDDGGSEGEARYEVDGKFWAISLDGSSHTVRFGKIGTAGTSKTKDFDDDAAAKKDHDKLVKEKTGKGYALVSGAAAPAPAATPAAAKKQPAVVADDDEDDDEDEDEDDDDESGEADGFRRFEVDEKFWAIQVDGASHTVRYGKIGTDGQEKTKSFADAAAAQKDADKLIMEKTSKGYEEVDGDD